PSKLAHFGPFKLDLVSGELRKYDTKLRLGEQPFQILSLLLQRKGQLVTRDELHKQLWPTDTFVDFEHGLNSAIRRLREALSDSQDNTRWVETVPRRGYRFIGDLEGEASTTLPAKSLAKQPEIPAKNTPAQISQENESDALPAQQNGLPLALERNR